jgi:hypothetical protein
MALSPTQRIELIQKMYVAYYGRPADTGGLDNWINHLVNNNDDASAIMQAFGTSPEATSLYGDPVDYAYAVNALYLQMFNRPAEPDGLALYVAHLNAGRVTLPNLALTIGQGARNSDLTTLENKIEVATAFTEELATSTENMLGYAGEDAAAHAAAYLASVTDANGSVEDALADLDSVMNTILGLDQLSSLPTHALTTGLDNLLGTNGDDVVLVNLTDGPNGEEDTLELNDAFNALLGQDTLRLDAWNGIDENSIAAFAASAYEMVGFERVLVQARDNDLVDNNLGENGNLTLVLDLEGMDGVDLEVRNMISGDDSLVANNIGGDVDVVNFDGYYIGIDGVGGDVSLTDANMNSNINFIFGGSSDININDVAGSVTLNSVYLEDFNLNENAELQLVRIDGDVTLAFIEVDDLNISNVGGSVSLEEFDIDDNVNINDVTGNVTITGELNENLNITTDIDGNVNILNIGGNLVITNVDGFSNLDINNVGGFVQLINFDVDSNLNIYNVGGDLTLTGNVDNNGNFVTYLTDEVHIDGIGGNVVITDINFQDDLELLNVAGNKITFNDVSWVDTNENTNINVSFANTVTDATINFNGFDASDSNFIDIDGSAVTKYTLNINEQTDINELHLSHSNEALSEVDINLNANLTIDALETADDSNGDIAATWTVNGSGNLVINSIADDDRLSVVYKGSGSIQIGDDDGNSDWEPENGSFNASTATGSVTALLDLNEASALDFTYVGSKGNDLVIIEEDSLGNAASDENTVVLSLAGGTGVDTLVVSSDTDLTADAMAAVSGFEVLELTDLNSNETFNLSETHEFTSVVLNDSDANDNDLSVINLSATQAQNITIMLDGYDSNLNDKNMFNDLNISLENTLGIADVVDLTVMVDGRTVGETASGDELDGNVSANEYMTLVSHDLILDEIETFNIEVSGDAVFRDAAGVLDGNSITTYIDVLDANELETLNISGNVSLEFADINTNDLRVIDARNFTGSYLGLGTEGDVFTDDDLTIYGSLTANHDIDVNINDNEDLVITTGSGVDNINAFGEGLQDVTISSGDGNSNIDVNANGDVTITSGNDDDNINVNTNINGNVIISSGDGNSNIIINGNDVTITSGSGDDNINVNANDDVVITSGAGNDDVNIEYADDVTVTLGDGNDSFDYIDSNIFDDLIINAGAGSDDINIYLDSDNNDSSNMGSATITLGAGADDLWLYDTRWDSNNDVVVTVTDFAEAEDVIHLDENANFVEGAEYVTVSTADGDYDLSDVLSALDIGVVEFTFAADNNAVVLDINSNGADLLTALGDDGDAIITVDDDQNGYIVAYNGGQAFIFNFDEQGEADADAVFAENTDGDSDGNDANPEDWYFTISTGVEGFDIGDTISLTDIDGEGEVLTYIVQTDDTALSTVMSGLVALVNGFGDRDFNAEYDGETLHLISVGNGDYGNVIEITYTNVQDTATINADEIELVGVLNNVTAGSLTINNFDFGIID